METINRSRPVISQTKNNTTLWIGHLHSDATDRLAGQTFACPSEGLMNNIQVYSAAVTQPGEMVLTLHEFDAASRTWGPAISQSALAIEKSDTAKWLRFELEPVSLVKNSSYGFRLQTEQGIIGIGEAVSHAHHPFQFGCAWNGHSHAEKGRYFNYFSLTFKVEMCA